MKDFSIQGLTSSLNPLSTVNQADKKPKGDDFGKVLFDQLKEVNKLQSESNKAIELLAAGKQENIHETMIAMEKASTSFQMMMQIRNKIIEAYDQVIKTTM
ncbi:MAG: flagellar hook-basal body complex protein FliE [Pseudomonadota bacterium]